MEVQRSNFNSQERTAKDQAAKQNKQPGHHIPLVHIKVKRQTIVSCVQSNEAMNYSSDIITSQRGTVLHNGKYYQKEKQGLHKGLIVSF